MEKLAKRIASEMIRYDIIPNNNDIYECYVYGLQLVISSILIFSTMIILAAISGYVAECILFAVFFCPLRALSGGYHCMKYSSCFFLSMAFWMILILLLFLHLSSHIIVSSVLIAIAAIYIFVNAPMEHQNNPLSVSEMKLFRKFVVLFLLIETMCYILFLKYMLFDYAFILSYSMMVVSILMMRERMGGD